MPDTDPATLTAAQVGGWLRATFGSTPSFAGSLDSYTATFEAEGVDGLTLCELQKEDLGDLGVGKNLHRVQIIKQWKAAVAAAHSTS